MHQLAADFPRMRIRLHSLPTPGLKEMLARGQCDFILTTEDSVDSGGETLATLPLVWIGAQNGTACRERPQGAFCGALHLPPRRPAGLPDLASQNINLYASGLVPGGVARAMADFLRQNCRVMSRPTAHMYPVTAAG